MFQRLFAPCALATVFVGICASGAAAQIESVVVFGDSLSDTGNRHILTAGGAAPFPWYSQGRYTNGPDNTAVPAVRTTTCVASGLWNDRLVGRLELPPLLPSISGGRNYAFAGATTESTIEFGVLNIGAQVNAYRAGPHEDPNHTLFLVWGGGNDIINATARQGATPERIRTAAVTAVNNLRTAILSLAIDLPPDAHITVLWPSLPPYGFSPLAQSAPDDLRDDFASAFLDFNIQQEIAIAAIRENSSFVVHTLDMEALYGSLIAGELGWVPADTTHQIILANFFANPQPSRNNGVPDGIDPDTYLWWDSIHFTARVNQLIGDAAACIVAPLTIVAQPASTDVCPGSEVRLSVTATGAGPISYQWRRKGVIIDGASTDTLTIQSVDFTDAGSYDCVASSPCGELTSDPATVSVRTCCPADFNDDDAVNSQDFFDFLAAFFALLPIADFNHDGSINSQDFFDFLAAFFAGC